MAELTLLPIDQLHPHPDNPRVVMREDVVSALVAGMNGEYPQKHAVHARPLGDDYQLLAGHHRREAAKRKGFTHVWAWVEELDDQAAFMELVTSNNQGELSPLEIGIHALKAVPKAEGGRGKKGGLSEYAEKVGRKHQYISQLRQAAEVVDGIPASQLAGFLDRAQHLCALHKLPRACWQAACEWLAAQKKSEGGADAKGVSVADVEKQVATTLAFRKEFAPGEEWDKYLPVDACTSAVFAGTDPGNFNRLLDIAQAAAERLKDHEELLKKWRAWLEENAGNDSWNKKKAQDYRIELEEEAWEIENADEPEPTAVNLILADPPWQYDFAETDNRQIENQYPTATVDEIGAHINAAWAPPVADDCVLFLWATMPKLKEALQVMEAWGFEYKTGAVWDKVKMGMGYWFRGQHELLLVGTKGNVSPPEPELRRSSVFREERGRHSAKPACVYEAIEAMFPKAVKCEFYQRAARDGWQGCGNEVPHAA